jgi:hypothetical protein
MKVTHHGMIAVDHAQSSGAAEGGGDLLLGPSLRPQDILKGFDLISLALQNVSLELLVGILSQSHDRMQVRELF